MDKKFESCSYRLSNKIFQYGKRSAAKVVQQLKIDLSIKKHQDEMKKYF